MGKIQPYSAQWVDRALDIVRCEVPKIYPCPACNNPTLERFCCRYCGSGDSGEPDNYDNSWLDEAIEEMNAALKRRRRKAGTASTEEKEG